MRRKGFRGDGMFVRCFVVADVVATVIAIDCMPCSSVKSLRAQVTRCPSLAVYILLVVVSESNESKINPDSANAS